MTRLEGALENYKACRAWEKRLMDDPAAPVSDWRVALECKRTAAVEVVEALLRTPRRRARSRAAKGGR